MTQTNKHNRNNSITTHFFINDDETNHYKNKMSADVERSVST